MPMDFTAYPETWGAFSYEIRFTRARGRCECTGQCGMHGPDPEPRRCLEIHGNSGKFINGRVKLTTAHLCDCYPICAKPDHVLAMCQRCHLRLDRYRHAAARLRTQAAPGYKAQRFRHRAKELHFDQLAELDRLPARKKNTFWIPGGPRKA